MELDELRKMKDTVESAAKDVGNTLQTNASEFEKAWNDTQAEVNSSLAFEQPTYEPLAEPAPEYRHPKKKWRIKQGAVPQWYKARAGVRTKALSGAARVARYRPQRPS